MLNTILEAIKLPLWDGEDFTGLVIRLLLHLVVVIFVVRYLYFNASRRKDYLFTYILISVVIFMLCFMLENVKLELGMALGLFAVFGIIRYRTSQIPIREMTYLFIVIGLAVINALANKKISFAELTLANAAIVFLTFIIERVWALKHVSRKVIVYDKIDLILPEKYNELKADLQRRLGFDIMKIEVGKVDFLRDSARLVIFYNANSKQPISADDLDHFTEDSDDE